MDQQKSHTHEPVLSDGGGICEGSQCKHRGAYQLEHDPLQDKTHQRNTSLQGACSEMIVFKITLLLHVAYCTQLHYFPTY